MLSAQIKPTFHKINIHAAMTPADIHKLLEPVFEQAKQLKDSFDKSKQMAEERQFRDQLSQTATSESVPSHGAQVEETSATDFSHKMPFVTVSCIL